MTGVATALITCLHLQNDFDRFRPQYEALGVTAVLPPIPGQQLDAKAMAELINGVDAAIVGDDIVDAGVLRAGHGSRLKAIVKWGVGTDAVDTQSARELDIPVFNTPGAFSDEVADLAISHLLMLVRRTHVMHASILEGGWPRVEGRTLVGRTAGIIGLGSIGLGIAKRAAALGMTVLGYDIRDLLEDECGRHGVQQTSLGALYEASDVIFLACNLTPENRHLISGQAFARMRDGVLIVNTARGALIDQAALVEALTSGKVAGAGLDVFEAEPLAMDDPLRSFADRCVFTPHNGSSTSEAVHRVNQMTTDILFHALGLKRAEHFTPNRVV